MLRKSTFKFRMEGLEPRILLSAVPVDGDVQSLEEPLFSDSVFVLDATTQELSAVSLQDSSEADLYSDSVPLNAVDEVFLSGTLEVGLLVEADIIHIADGTVLDGVQLSAGAIHIGAASWSGDNTVLADRLSFLTDQSAEQGATLTLSPRTVDAAIALGFEDTGFSLNAEEMVALVAAGLEQLIIGLSDGAHDVSVDGLAYEGNLLLRSPEDGGEFYILSQIDHSGGTLAYEGSGQTQNTSADTVTSGNEILVNDSLNLVYAAGSGNKYGDNTIYFDTTNNGAVGYEEGADILISGDILGTGIGNGGTLYLNAGTTGDIVIQGGVGTLEALGGVVIVNAHDVTFEGNIILESFEQQDGTGSSTFGATASNFVLTGGGDFIVKTTNNVTFGGDIESAYQNVEITVDPFATSGKVWFKGDVNIDNGDLIVHAAKDFEITGNAEIIGSLQQTVGASESIFRAAVQADTIDLFAQQRIRFLSTVTLLEGDMELVADEIDFEGGAGSIIGAQDADGIGISRLFLRPTASSVTIDIGDPTGGDGTFELSSTDIAALADGFALITVGFHTDTGQTSTNAVRIGGAAFLDALEVFGGSFLVNGSFSARTSLLLEADDGAINITGTQIRVRNEQVDNVWQSSELTLRAHSGDIQTANGAALLIDNDDPTDTAEGSTINLIATQGSVLNESDSFGFIEARDLNVEAGQSITVLTDVETVSARSTSQGDIQINELGELHVIRGITANGAITVSTGGDTVVDLLESQTDSATNTIAVEVSGGNLHVDRMLAGALGSVQLDVEGQVTGFSQTDRSALLDLPRVIISGGDDGAQATGEWTLQGVTIVLNSTLFTDAFNDVVFRLVASEEPSGTPVRVELVDGVYTIYALPGTATHAQVVTALDDLSDFDVSITAGSSAVLDLPAITLSGGVDAPAAAASGSYDIGSTVLDVVSKTTGADANDTRIIFAADSDGVASADWDAAAQVLTLHYVPGVTAVGVLRNLINSTTDADLTASLGSGTGTQILGVDSVAVTGGATASKAAGTFTFDEGVLTITGDAVGSALNGVEIYLVGDADSGTNGDWDDVADILTVSYTAGVSTLANVAQAIIDASAGISGNVTSGNSAAVLDIPTTELNGGRDGVPASGDLLVDGLSLRLTDSTGTVTDSGPTFRLVGALVDGDDLALTVGEPVRILADGDDYTIYALAGVATHTDVLAAVNALSDFSASIVDAHVVGNILGLNTQTGQGEALNPLQIRANQVQATNTDSGLVRLQQDDNRTTVDVAIDNQSSVDGDYVAFTVLGGNAKVTTVNTVIQDEEGEDVVVSVAGIQAASDAGVLIDVAGSLTVDADVNSEGGPLTVRAVDTIEIAAGVSLESNGGDVSFTSLEDFSMAVDASVLTDGGALAVDVGGDMLLGALDASLTGSTDRDQWGDVALRATGYIQDYSASDLVNVSARSLQMNAGTTIGQMPDGTNERALEVNVLTFAAESDAGVIVIQSVADISVGEVAAFNPDMLSADGSIVSGPEIAALTGILNDGGGDVLVASAGSLTAADSIVTSGAGRIVLIGDSLTIEDAITSAGGALSISATNDLTLTATADLDTNGGGEILLNSVSGSMLAAADSAVTAVDGSILFSALANITLGTVFTGGDLGLKATTGSILAASGGLASRRVLTSDTLAIVAGDSVAGANGGTDALLIDVNTISLTGDTGAVYNFANDGSLAVDTTSVSVTHYDAVFEATAVAIEAQSDLSVAGEGDVIVKVTNAGDFELAAAREIRTTGAGTILLDVDGALTMGEASHIDNANGAITLDAGGTISVAQVSSISGDVTVTSASGSIIDVDPAQATVDFETAGQLTLSASTGIGIEAGDRQTLSVLLGTLAASTTTGGIFVSSADSFATNGVVSTTSGTISLLSGNAITVGPNQGGVAVNSAADLVLRAGTELTQLPDGTIAAANDISLYADTAMTLFSVSTTGNVALESSGAVMGYAAPTVAAITANGLLLDGIGSMGTPAQRLSLDVGMLAGTVAQGTLAFDNAKSLSLESVDVSTRQVAPMGTLPTVLRLQTATTVILNSGLDAGSLIGAGLFATIDGDLNVSAAAGLTAAVAVTQALPVLWETTGDQTWSGLLDLAAGDSTLRATGAIELAATAGFTSNGGNLSVEAGGDFTLSSTAGMDLASGSLLVNAGNSVIVAGQVITTGAVALLAADSIAAGAAGGALRVSAADLLLTAGHGIGSELSVLTTEVAQISASAGAAGIYINNTGAVRVTNLGFAVTSYAADSASNVAFSGFQGGIQTQLSGAIQFENAGAVTVDQVKSEIQAFPGEAFELALLLDDAGPDGNAVSVLFEVIREEGDTIDASEDETIQDLRDGNPPTTYFNETSQVLRVFVRNEISTVAQIIAAINADADFSGAAIQASGRSDGSTIFSLGASAESAFFADNGADEGIEVYGAGASAGGADAIAAYAEVQPGDATYAIRVTSTDPGAAANAFVLRLLDDGPGGNLTDATDSALVEWDDSANQLNVYLNSGYTTAGEIIDAINRAGAVVGGAPFAAAFSGVFDPADAGDVIGDASVLMVSNLAAEATIRSVGVNNDFSVISSAPGPLYNGINFRFVDDGLVGEQGVRASFDDVENIMSIYIDSAVSQASAVVAAVNAEGTFVASLTPELTTANNGTGVIQATRFALRDGAVAVNASVTVGMVGSNNDFVITANEPGDDQNTIEVVLVSDDSIIPGAATASFSDVDDVLEIRINPDFATAGGIFTAINLGSNADSIPFTASLPGSTTGFGGITLATLAETTGGTGSSARAVVNPFGENNGFEVVADSDSTLLQDISVFIIDDGSIDDGSALASYLPDTRTLILNVQNGVTTANTLLTEINSAAVPVSATLISESDGSGTFGNESQAFVNGADAIVANLTTVLPSAVEVQLAATIGGVINNGIQVSYALDPALAAGTASATLFEADSLRLLQVRFADATTTLRALQDFFDANPELSFEVANIDTIEAEVVGDLAPVSVAANEGSISLSASGAISLLGRVTSQTGAVSVTTNNSGNLSFDATTTRISAIDGITVDLDGAFINNASLESPLLKVYDASLLRIDTGALQNSTESIRLETNGHLEIDGAGLNLDQVDLSVDAVATVDINSAITATGATTISIDSGDTFTLTVNGRLEAETVTILSGNEAVLAGSVDAGSVSLTADDEIRQSGIIDSDDAISVISSGGAILMSGTATTRSDSGAILYSATGEITVTSVESTDGGAISLISGAAISNVRALPGTNVSTSGEVILTAVSGIGQIGTAIAVESGTLSLNNSGGTGDIVITERTDGADLEITSLTQAAANGRSVLTSEGGDVHFTGAAQHNGAGAMLVVSSGSILTDAIATLNLGGGALTLRATTDVSLMADVSSNGGDVYIDAGADLRMASDMTLSAAGGGDVALLADGDVEVAQVLSLFASVYIASANGAVLRSANDGRTNVLASQLQLSAGTAIGALTTIDDAMIIEVGRLTATAQNGVLAIDSLNDLSVGETNVTVAYAKADGTLDTAAWTTDQLLTNAGNAVLRGRGALTFETITAKPTVQVDGNALISAAGTLRLLGDAVVATGSAHFTSADAFTLNGDFTLTGAGTVLFESGADFSQAVSSTILTNNQDAIISAAAALSIHSVDAGSGDLALTAGGAISRLSTAPATQVIANALRLSSGGAIASVADPLVVDVVTLTAAATGGIRLNSAGSVEVTSVSVTTDTVSTIGEIAAQSARTEATQSDISSSAGGDLLLQFAGDLILQDGDDDDRAVGTNGDGRIFLGAASLDAYAAIRSLNGDITLVIDGGAHWISVAESAPAAGDATTAGVVAQSGDIFIRTGADLLMDADGYIRANAGNIGVDVTGSLTVGTVEAALGYVHLETTGAILDGGDAALDLIADRLQIQAGNGAGVLGAGAYNPLEISVNRLSAQISNGPLALVDANDVQIGLTAGSVNQLDIDGVASVALDGDDALFGIDLVGSATLVASGTITAMAALAETPDLATIRIGNAGDLLLQANATGASVIVNGDIEGAGGSLTLSGTAGVSLAATTTVATQLGGTLTMLSSAGGLTMATGSTLSATLGDIVVNTAGTIAVAGIETDGNVALTSTAGSIADNEADRTNVMAGTLYLNANSAVGASSNAFDTEVDTLSARTSDGSLYLLEVDGLNIGATAATSGIVAANGVVTPTLVVEQSGVVTGGASGHVIITLSAGDLAVLSSHVVSAAGTGRILFDTPGELSLSAAVSSGEGSITLLSSSDFSLAAGIEVSTAGVGQIHLTSGGDLLAAADSRFVASTGNVALTANGNLILGGISTEGRAALISETGHIRAAGSTAFELEVLASYLLLRADNALNGGIGTLAPATAQSFRTQVGRVAAVAGAEGIHLINAEGVTVGSVLVSTSKVTASADLAAQADLTLSDLTTVAGSASIVLRTTSGSIILTEGGDLNAASVVAHGAGNVLLSAANDLTANASVLSTSGHLTVRAVNTLTLESGSTIGTATSGTILVQSTDGSVTMGDTAIVRATESAILLDADGSVTLGLIEGRSVAVESATGSILRASGAATNITAADLLLSADTGVASAAAAVRIDVDTLAASTRAGGLFLLESSDAVVAANVTVTVSEVTADSSSNQLPELSLGGLSTAVDGAIILVSTAGSLELATGASVVAATSGLVRVEAATDLTVNADVMSGTGHLSLLAVDGISFGAGLSVATAGSGDIYIDAGSAALTQVASTITSAGANVRLAALGDVTLGSVSGVGISVVSGGNILAAAGSVNNLSASSLRLNAGAGIGAGSRHLTSAVADLSALAQDGSIFITESNDVTVTSVSVVTNQVSATATTSTQTDLAQADLRTGGNGDIVLVSLAGAITLNDGNSDDAVVVADGSGSILVGAASDLSINSGVASGSGHIALAAGNSLMLAGTSVTTTSGDISLSAIAGQIMMPATATLTTSSGNLRISAQGTAVVGQLTADSVSLRSDSGSLLGAAFSTINVTADSLRMFANAAIGAADSHLLTNVATLSAHSTTDAIFITEDTAITVTSVRVETTGLVANGGVLTVTDTAQSDLTAGGAIVLVVKTGDLTLNDGNALLDQTAGDARFADTIAVQAGGAGGLLLHALDGQLIANASLQATTGDLTVRASDSVSINASTVIATTGAGDLSVESEQGALTFAPTASVSGAGSVRLASANDLTVGAVSAASVSLQSTTGAILNDGATATEVIASAGLRLSAAGSIGTASHHLRTDAAVLSARSSGGGLFLSDSSSTTVASVRVETTEFTATAAGTVVIDAAQSDLVTLNNGDIILVLSSGDLTLNDGTSIVNQSGGDARSANGNAVVAHGTGRIYLQAAGSLTANTDIESTTGLVTIQAENLLTLETGVTIQTGADISLRSNAGAILMDGTAAVIATGSVLRVAADDAITLGNLTGATVSLLAGDVISNAIGSTLNVSADAVRISAIAAIGAANRHLTVDVDTLAAYAENNGLFLTAQNTVTVAPVATVVSEFTSSAVSTTVNDVALNHLTALNDGAIVLQSLAGNIEVPNVISSGSGAVLLSAADALTLTGGLDSGSGSLSLLAENAITLGLGTSVLSSTNGSVLIESANGAFTMSGNAVITAANAAVGIHADGAITLGVTTGNAVSLISTDGGIRRAATVVTTVLADSLRIDASGSVGTLERDFTADVSLMSIAASSVHLKSINGSTVGTVAVTLNRLLADLSTETVEDAALSGVVTTSGGLIDITTDAGDLTLSATAGVITAGAAGNVLLTIDGDFYAGADITSVSGTLTLNIAGSGSLQSTLSTAGDIAISSGSDWTMTATSVVSGALVTIDSGADLTLGNVSGNQVNIDAGAKLLSANGSTRNIVATTAASLVARDGIGASRSNYNVSVETPVLTVENLTAGSAYLSLVGTTRVDQLNLHNSGSLQLNLTGGDLDLASGGTLGLGSAVVRVNGALQLGGSLTANGDIQLTAQSLDVDLALSLASPLLESSDRSIELRVSGDLSFPAGVILRAAQGDIKMTVGGELSLPVVFADGVISIRGNNTIVAAGIGNTAHLLTAESIQLLAGADLGASGQPIVTQTERLDAQASGTAEIVELNDLEIGRYGLRLQNAESGDTFVLRLDDGTASSLSSVSGVVNVDGDFVVRSDGEVTLQTRLVNDNGDIFLEVGGLQFALAGAEPIFTAANGLLDLDVGAGGVGSGLSLSAEQLTALVESGDFTALIEGSSELTVDGIVLTDATGNVTLTVDGGDFTLDGAVVAEGGIHIDIPDGALTSTASVADSPVLVAGDQTIELELGTGATGANGDAIVTAALRFSAVTDSGDLNLEFRPSGSNTVTNLVDQGLTIRSGGVGNISLLVSGHNLDLDANVEHAGFGSVSLDVESGGLEMYATSSVLVNSGTLNLSARDFMVVNYIENLTGSSSIESDLGLIVRNTAPGTSTINFRGANGPVIRLNNSIILFLDVDSALVNDILFERPDGDEFLLISGSFQ